MATLEEIRVSAENDLEFFIGLIAPTQVLGNCHKDVIQWWSRQNYKHHQLLLFPRDHGKSRLVAYRVAWELTKDPTLRVLYISATANLAEKQLTFIKGLMTSDVYRRYWPNHINKEEGKRAKWTNSEISLDHPLRKEENIRDPSVFTAGLTTSITGMHCDIAVLDDVVVSENAYTSEGRNKVRAQYSLLSSIEGAGAKEWVVGTRYHPKDLYNDMMCMVEDIYDDSGEKVNEENIYETFERAVEDFGDGTGEFLWPRQQRRDGKWFGFDMKILAQKRGKYLDRVQFRAQYYNDPSDPDSRPIEYSQFQYFDRKHLRQEDGYWMFKNNRLNLVASVDFAYSIRKTADYTAVVVIGVDADNNIYVLDIERFRTSDISVYFERIFGLYNKWGFKKLCAEVTAAQQAIVKSLKHDYIAVHGLALKVEEVRPTRHQGSKEERMEATLMPRYDNNQVYHYRGGNIQILEEELVTQNPAHDDVKDALTTAIEHAVKPAQSTRRSSAQSNVIFHSRFGGRAF
jgi:phage terminase large subunit-like protein